MAKYILIHGAGDVGWYWHLVAEELRAHGHEVIAPDLPVDDKSATLNDYADSVIAAAGDDGEAIVVAHSFGGFTAPIVASRIPTDLIVLVAGMVPSPGESATEMFSNTGYQQEPQEDPGDLAVFYHDVPPELGREALSRGREQASKGWEDPFPLDAWPDVPTKAIVGRQDRIFPAAWLTKVTHDRLGVDAAEIDAGHCIALVKPRELATMLETYRAEVGA
jgi:pimeloyl-ACP methyl ester carboxylesterase